MLNDHDRIRDRTVTVTGFLEGKRTGKGIMSHGHEYRTVTAVTGFLADSPALNGDQSDDPSHHKSNKARDDRVNDHDVQFVVNHTGDGIAGLYFSPWSQSIHSRSVRRYDEERKSDRGKTYACHKNDASSYQAEGSE